MIIGCEQEHSCSKWPFSSEIRVQYDFCTDTTKTESERLANTVPTNHFHVVRLLALG